MQKTIRDIVQDRIPPQIIISVIFVIMLAIGYGEWNQETSGNLVITSGLSNVSVFIDSSYEGLIKNPNEKLTFHYTKGKHSVIVSRNDYYPWAKNIEITAKKDTEIKPFFVKKENEPKKITGSSVDNGTLTVNSDYLNYSSQLENVSVDSKFLAPLSEMNKSGARSVAYFPSRTDVLLVAINDGVFAIETGSTTPRNFFPIYKGTSPTFIVGENNSLIVKDNDNIYRIVGYAQ